MSSEKTENQLVKYDDALFADDILKRAMQTRIVTPADYSMENAIKSAYLEIYEKDYFNKCSKNSVINACMDMIVQGLNPVKDQCYFIKFGNVLKCMRSYMGSIAVTKRFDPRVEKVHAEVIYEGDKVDYDIVNGVKCNIVQKQSFGNINKDKILGAYAIALDIDGNEIEADLMTWDEILKSWERSQKTGETKPIINGKINPNSDHSKHPARFCRRTVINRLCKTLISATDDKELLKAVIKSDEDSPIIDIVQDEIDQNANQKIIDFKPSEQKEEPASIMATEEQYKIIYDLSGQLNQTDKTLDEISGYFQKEIARITDLTFDEAAEYISVLNDQIEDGKRSSADGPDWQS